jgi:hypothetical protein
MQSAFANKGRTSSYNPPTSWARRMNPRATHSKAGLRRLSPTFLQSWAISIYPLASSSSMSAGHRSVCINPNTD